MLLVATVSKFGWAIVPSSRVVAGSVCFHGLTTAYGRSCTVAGILHHRLTSLGCGIALIYSRNGRALRVIAQPIHTPGTAWHFESEPATSTFGLMVAALGTSTSSP